MKIFHARYVVTVAILCLVAGGSFYVRSEYRKRAQIEAAKQKLAHIEEVKHKLAILNADYTSKQSARAAMTRQKVQAILSSAASRSGALSENASLPFRGVKNVTWCVWARAKEIAFKKTDLQDRVRNAMQPTAEVLNSTRKQILGELEKFRIESIAAGNQLRLTTLELSNEAGIQPPSLPEISLHPIEANIQEVATLNAFAAVGATVEIMLIRDTVSAIVVVVGGMAEREAVLLISAATLFEVPIVDLIVAAAAIGGTVWTVADIYAAVLRQQELPGVIKRDIDAQLADMGAASRKFIATVEASTNIPTPSINL